MLILNRRRGEAIVLDGGIRIVVLECDRRGARIGIEAPAETNIRREELLLRVTSENKRARATGEHEWVKALTLKKPADGSDAATAIPVTAAASLGNPEVED